MFEFQSARLEVERLGIGAWGGFMGPNNSKYRKQVNSAHAGSMFEGS